MTATAVPVTTWQGCYSDSWQDLIVPEAFAHPAKFARGLIHRIYRHLLEQGYVRPGETVLDPFGGVGLGALDAMTYGLRYVGVELEPRFVALGQQNLTLWRQRYGFTGGTLVQGDSRQLRQVLAGAQVGCVVGSPPYSQPGSQPPNVPGYGGKRPPVRSAWPESPDRLSTYGTTPGQLGAMPPGVQAGCVVGSPPYADQANTPRCTRYTNGRDALPDGIGDLAAATGNPSTYGTTPGQLGAMPPGVQAGCVVGSPPYAEGLSKEHTYTDHAKRDKDSHRRIMTEKGIVDPFYGTTPGQLGIEPSTFWAASAQIMAELAALLPPGAVCAWVLKAYVSKKQIVPFPDQWRALCEAHGFVLVEEIHASLVEDHGTQEGLFGEAQRVTTEKKSFFRRLAEKKGSPRIDHETVLIVRKAGDAGGMCCVSSPPFGEHDNRGNRESLDRFHAACVRDGNGHGGRLGPSYGHDYGTTPGNLGNMPVGMCVVGSPPFTGITGNRPARPEFYDHPTQRLSHVYADTITAGVDSYGTTPGNLGNMPVERS